jgi:hypothetical protein
MINWQLIRLYNKPDGWTEESQDGVYGDLVALEASCNAGEQQILYLLRMAQQREKLEQYTGTSGGEPQEPAPLRSLDEECGQSSADGWE